MNYEILQVSIPDYFDVGNFKERFRLLLHVDNLVIDMGLFPTTEQAEQCFLEANDAYNKGQLFLFLDSMYQNVYEEGVC
ncbi:UNVERIFIED_ORG: hypothetical protein ABRZ91_001084 [Heyndrickxia coagulans]